MVLRPLPTRAVRRGAAHGFGCGGRYRKSASAFTLQKMRPSMTTLMRLENFRLTFQQIVSLSLRRY